MIYSKVTQSEYKRLHLLLYIDIKVINRRTKQNHFHKIMAYNTVALNMIFHLLNLPNSNLEIWL